MYKMSSSFVCIFVVNYQFFPSNSLRVCHIKLKIDMLHYMSNTFRNTVFQICQCAFKGMLYSAATFFRSHFVSFKLNEGILQEVTLKSSYSEVREDMRKNSAAAEKYRHCNIREHQREKVSLISWKFIEQYNVLFFFQVQQPKQW